MGFWSNLWSGVSKAFSPVVNAVSAVLQNSPLLQKLMPMLGVVIPPPFDIVAVVALEVISASLGKPENPDELGWQMNQADKKPEDFESFDEYKEYLDKEYPFDRDAFEAQTDEQKAACRYVGIAGTMEELKSAKGFELNATALGVLAGAATTLGWSEKTMRAFTDGMFQSIGGAGLNSLADFAKGALDAVASGKMDEAVGAGVKEAGVSDTVETVKGAMSDTAASIENV